MAAAGTASSPPRSPTAPLSETDPDPDPSPPSAAPEIQSQQTPSINPRRPPPPCWSPDETVALIDIYREKWNSLGRGSLKPNHWQEVADAVATRCPGSSPLKTATQCRHKMEKLRKRYRAEIRRAESLPVSRFTSSWVHFKQMETLDRSHSGSDVNDDDDDDNEDIDPDFLGPGKRKKVRASSRISSHPIRYPSGLRADAMSRTKNNGGFRIKIPTAAPPKPKPGSTWNSFEPNNNSSSIGTRQKRSHLSEKRSRPSSDPLDEVVSAVKVFRVGFERMERMKIELAKEMGEMQREMEMKRTEMILESQQFVVETLAKAIPEKKRAIPEKKRKIKIDDEDDNLNNDKNDKENEETPERIPTPEAES